MGQHRVTYPWLLLSLSLINSVALDDKASSIMYQLPNLETGHKSTFSMDPPKILAVVSEAPIWMTALAENHTCYSGCV